MDNLLRFIESEGQFLGEEVIRVMTLTEDMDGDVAIVGAARDLSCPGANLHDRRRMRQRDP